MQYPTYAIADREWDLRTRGDPGTDVRFDLIDGGDGCRARDQLDRSAEPRACDAAVSEEAFLRGPPGFREGN